MLIACLVRRPPATTAKRVHPGVATRGVAAADVFAFKKVFSFFPSSYFFFLLPPFHFISLSFFFFLPEGLSICKFRCHYLVWDKCRVSIYLDEIIIIIIVK